LNTQTSVKESTSARNRLPEPHRPATPDDAQAMVDLVNYAGEGMPDYIWARIAEPGQSARDVGLERARRDSGAFTWRNTVVRDDEGTVSAALIGYPLPDVPEPGSCDGLPPMFVPLQELEDLACGTWYINVLATYPEHRGRGFGAALLKIAESKATQTGCHGLSLIVSDANEGARRLYERHGYNAQARRTMVKDGWQNDGSEWLLMVCPLPRFA
jgi:ribosomal protein S18 acetylase RimI-like enzyme